MNFSQKIYLNDKPLILTIDKESYISNNPAAKAYTFYSGASLQNYTRAIQQLEKQGAAGAIIEDASQGALLTQLQALYKPIDAAGGVVFNERNEFLMIYRRGKWDLPKGKLDKGETIEVCALREVSEETGVETLSIESKICDTYHIYSQYNEQLLKRTAWYRMKGTSADKLNPQKEENILEARWVNELGLPALAAKSYEAVRDVLRSAGLRF